MVPFSVLDLAPIIEGGTAADALATAARLARHAEALGLLRYWVAEHHNMPGIASSATAVVIGHVAAATSRIRVGAGGIMLPNHAPLIIAEQFGTLAALFPHRIDLGLGRAPGTDPRTLRALRRDLTAADHFAEDVQELRGYFGATAASQAIRAIPALDVQVPIWLLGSSLYSAQLAALLGLPFSFAAHFAPELLMPALALYRERFQPSEALERAYAMVAVNIIAADSDDAARRLFSSHQQAFTQLRRGRPAKLPPPIDAIDDYWTREERAMAEQSMRYSFVGSPATIAPRLAQFLQATRPEELMVHAMVHDETARLRSLTLTAGLRDRAWLVWLATLALLWTLWPPAVRAQTDEIQVYDAAIAAPGVFNLTWHNNYTPSGRPNPDYPGGIVPNHALNGVPEWAYGVAPWFEAGLYMPLYSLSRDGAVTFNGFKLRALFVEPNAADKHFVYGLNFEFSYNTEHWDQNRYSQEMRPIVGWHVGPWDIIVNPILDNTYKGFAELDFAPASRLAYNIDKTWALAVEEYDDFGPLRKFKSPGQQQHQLFGVFDFKGQPWMIEVGAGVGLTSATDKVVLKLILSRDLN